MVGFIGKVVAASAAIAIAIKYGGPLLGLPATSAVALTLVLAPSVVVGTVLIWQWNATGSSHADNR